MGQGLVVGATVPQRLRPGLFGHGPGLRVAEQAWGQALRHRGAHDHALTHLQRSLRCAEEAGAAPTAVAARLTMAFLLAERGRPAQALDELDRVVDTLDDPRGRARALAQRGGVLLDLGRHGEALDHYREALPVLRARARRAGTPR